MHCPGRILVVDDDANSRALLRRILNSHGHEVVEAADGNKALEAVDEYPPDLILLDIVMPHMDGIELCRSLKGNPSTAPIPILLVTGTNDRQDQTRGIQAGANDLLFKPVSAEHVVLRVRNALHMKMLFDRVKQDLDRVRELEHLRGCLTHAISADIQSLLRVTAGYLELLKSEAGPILEEQQRGYIDSCLDLTGEFVRRTQALGDISRLEQAAVPLDKQCCDIREIVEAAVGLVVPPERCFDVDTVIGGTPIPVECDPSIILRVIENLIDNAVKFTTPSIPISVGVSQGTQGVRVTVSDGGMGIPPWRQTAIFRMFNDEESSLERHSLSGLGLAFCKLAVEAHAGRIGVDSVPGQGSTFWFELNAPGRD